MDKKTIRPIKKLSGELFMPGDKSISHRAIMLGALSRGRTQVKGILDCDDCNYTAGAFRAMGIRIDRIGGCTQIEGRGLKGLKKPEGPINVGNSGTSMRLLAGILAGQDFETTLEGDQSLSRRPMARIVEPLSLMGVDIRSSNGALPPIKIKGGGVRPIDYKMPIPSAQVKSAVLLAGLYGHGTTTVEEAFKSRDHTERMLKHFGARLRVEGLKVFVEGGAELKSSTIEIPGDISSAGFFIVGAILLPGSHLRINKVSINPTRAGILDVLSMMGAHFKILNVKDAFEPYGDIVVESGPTRGITIERAMIPRIIDELPIIFVLSSLSQGRTVIHGAEELRVKETDRIRSMKENLERMGAKIDLEGDSLVIEGAKALKGASLKSFDDHRTCMALAIAALASKGESSMDDIECVNKSFPEFFEVLENISQ